MTEETGNVNLTVRHINVHSATTRRWREKLRMKYKNWLQHLRGNKLFALVEYLINMDETAVYLNYTPSETKYPIGHRTVAVMIAGTS